MKYLLLCNFACLIHKNIVFLGNVCYYLFYYEGPEAESFYLMPTFSTQGSLPVCTHPSIVRFVHIHVSYPTAIANQLSPLL